MHLCIEMCHNSHDHFAISTVIIIIIIVIIIVIVIIIIIVIIVIVIIKIVIVIIMMIKMVIRHDYFTISSPGAPPQPVICGTMQVIIVIFYDDAYDEYDLNIQSGTHLYVEMEGREGLGCAQLSITQVIY